jgi:hypothetical protein
MRADLGDARLVFIDVVDGNGTVVTSGAFKRAAISDSALVGS